MNKNWTIEDLRNHEKKRGTNEHTELWAEKNRNGALGDTTYQTSATTSSSTGNAVVGKQNKYRNKKIETVDGKFDSKKEFNRWRDLQALWNGGQIENLERQVRFYFKCNTVLINGKEIKLPYQLFRYYVADFVYLENGIKIVEDAKGARLNSFKRQKLLMKLVYGIEVKEV
jgi:hypothetical protein